MSFFKLNSLALACLAVSFAIQGAESACYSQPNTNPILISPIGDFFPRYGKTVPIRSSAEDIACISNEAKCTTLLMYLKIFAHGVIMRSKNLPLHTGMCIDSLIVDFHNENALLFYELFHARNTAFLQHMLAEGCKPHIKQKLLEIFNEEVLRPCHPFEHALANWFAADMPDGLDGLQREARLQRPDKENSRPVKRPRSDPSGAGSL